MRFILLITSILLFSCCSPKHTLDSSNDRTEGLPPEARKLLECDEANIVFKDEVHPQLVQRCGDCHGSTRRPTFAIADLTKSQLVVAPLINFGSIEDSLIIEQARNGHCDESGCSQPAGSAADVQLVDSIEAWRGSISACSQDDGTNPPIIDTRPIEEKEGYKFFIEELRPVLLNTQKCQDCHAGVDSWLYRQAFRALKFQSDRKSKKELKAKLKPLEKIMKRCEKKRKYQKRIKRGKKRNPKKEKTFPADEVCEETETQIAEALKDFDTRDELYVPPEFLIGTDTEQYSKIRARMRIEEDSFFASRIYTNAEGNHFGNGLCARDESPCKEIEAWWGIEKGK